mmetsp:Transcript_128860/g.240995  ORF Transcript_128860/g.240995 Transcript_128860/m.240995 type:complete len:210 (-) Transcript_128860:33-662(-)
MMCTFENSGQTYPFAFCHCAVIPQHLLQLQPHSQSRTGRLVLSAHRPPTLRLAKLLLHTGGTTPQTSLCALCQSCLCCSIHWKELSFAALPEQESIAQGAAAARVDVLPRPHLARCYSNMACLTGEDCMFSRTAVACHCAACHDASCQVLDAPNQYDSLLRKTPGRYRSANHSKTAYSTKFRGEEFGSQLKSYTYAAEVCWQQTKSVMG